MGGRRVSVRVVEAEAEGGSQYQTRTLRISLGARPANRGALRYVQALARWVLWGGRIIPSFPFPSERANYYHGLCLGC